MSFLRAWRGMVRRPAPRGQHSRRLAVEALEDRTLPSTLTVLTNADSGDGSLRAAISGASSGDEIVFDQSLQGETITLTSGKLGITKSLDIEGPGADQLTISGNKDSLIFDISGSVTATIAGLTIANGYNFTTSEGGGIYNDGTLTLSDCTITGNSCGGDNGYGGGIFNGGTLTLTNSTVSGNYVSGDALASSDHKADGGGIFNGGTLTVSNSTVSGNSASAPDQDYSCLAYGGGIYNSGTLTVSNSTLLGQFDQRLGQRL